MKWARFRVGLTGAVELIDPDLGSICVDEL